jgi:hypothetical protein
MGTKGNGREKERVRRVNMMKHSIHVYENRMLKLIINCFKRGEGDKKE